MSESANELLEIPEHLSITQEVRLFAASKALKVELASLRQAMNENNLSDTLAALALVAQEAKNVSRILEGE